MSRVERGSDKGTKAKAEFGQRKERLVLFLPQASSFMLLPKVRTFRFSPQARVFILST